MLNQQKIWTSLTKNEQSKYFLCWKYLHLNMADYSILTWASLKWPLISVRQIHLLHPVSKEKTLFVRTHANSSGYVLFFKICSLFSLSKLTNAYWPLIMPVYDWVQWYILVMIHSSLFYLFTVAVEYMRCSLYQSSLNVDSVLQRMQGSVVLAMCQACQFIRNNCWKLPFGFWMLQQIHICLWYTYCFLWFLH